MYTYMGIRNAVWMDEMIQIGTLEMSLCLYTLKIIKAVITIIKICGVK